MRERGKKYSETSYLEFLIQENNKVYYFSQNNT